MEAPEHLPPSVAAVWVELVAEHGDNAGRILGPEFEAYCATITNLRDAQQRIHDEQIIVPDSKNATGHAQLGRGPSGPGSVVR